MPDRELEFPDGGAQAGHFLDWLSRIQCGAPAGLNMAIVNLSPESCRGRVPETGDYGVFLFVEILGGLERDEVRYRRYWFLDARVTREQFNDLVCDAAFDAAEFEVRQRFVVDGSRPYAPKESEPEQGDDFDPAGVS